MILNLYPQVSYAILVNSIPFSPFEAAILALVEGMVES
jgi:hypothetical protein